MITMEACIFRCRKCGRLQTRDRLSVFSHGGTYQCLKAETDQSLRDRIMGATKKGLQLGITKGGGAWARMPCDGNLSELTDPAVQSAYKLGGLNAVAELLEAQDADG